MVPVILEATREGFLEASRLDITGGEKFGHMRVEEGRGGRHRGREVQVHGGASGRGMLWFPPSVFLGSRGQRTEKDRRAGQALRGEDLRPG